jgi:REP element-mobilizing transposase RayT
MISTSEQLQVTGIPPYIGCWSAISIPGFAVAILDRWQRNYGTLPSRFAMVACPQVEINAMGGLPNRVHELTNSRVRIQHFTGCHRPYLVILLFGEDAEVRREEIQQLLPWSEGYLVESLDGMTQLRFIEAIEEIDHDG